MTDDMVEDEQQQILEQPEPIRGLTLNSVKFEEEVEEAPTQKEFATLVSMTFNP